jgi:hypothetical protein
VSSPALQNGNAEFQLLDNLDARGADATRFRVELRVHHMYYLARIPRDTTVKKDKDKWAFGPFKEDIAKDLKKLLSASLGRGDFKVLAIDGEYYEVCFPVGMSGYELMTLLKEKVLGFLKAKLNQFKVVDIHLADLDGKRDEKKYEGGGGGGGGGGGFSKKMDRYLG